jgi:hypothetical protein
MEVLNELLGGSKDAEPPSRSIEGVLNRAREQTVAELHKLVAESSNAEEPEGHTRLPPPKQLMLTTLSEVEAAELIERHADYVNREGRSVHLPMEFVRHFLKRDDGDLPQAFAVTQLPIVLENGKILAPDGLDRGVVFRIEPELRRLLPHSCNTPEVAEAMRFLCDEWLVDVLTDYTGKCVIIADALTLIERTLLDDRPAFVITAGRRGSGKTTLLHMLITAVCGHRAAAAAWSTNEEERRKGLLSLLMSGVAAIVWDNIKRGEQLSCPHIERSCTSGMYSDRRLGVSETVTTAATSVHHFTGNNIGTKGDLSSRSLTVRLEVSQADPENRPFEHTDPVGWTDAHRGRILAALYTVLLGNPELHKLLNSPANTRFKKWWRLVGSAVENAAKLHEEFVTPGIDDCAAHTIDFKDLFLRQEEADEEGTTLADVLEQMITKWTVDRQAKASDIALLINRARDASDRFTDPGDRELGNSLRDLLFSEKAPALDVIAKAVAKQLAKRVGEPVKKDKRTFILRAQRDDDTNTLQYYVDANPN